MAFSLREGEKFIPLNEDPTFIQVGERSSDVAVLGTADPKRLTVKVEGDVLGILPGGHVFSREKTKEEPVTLPEKFGVTFISASSIKSKQKEVVYEEGH